MENPLVSIIVPVYNTAEYVEECILSILSQSYKNVELILVNDGSTDGSGEICKNYEHLPNVHYIEKENAGVVEARKQGVEEAHGEWIMFVDSDDFLWVDSVQQMMQRSTGVDIVIGRHDGYTFNNSWLKFSDYLKWEDYLYALFVKNILGAPWAKLFKRELINNCFLAFEYNIPRSEDTLMNLAIAIVNRKKVSICKEDIYHYRTRKNSTKHTFKLTFDYCENLCSIAESMVWESFPVDKMLKGSINHRMHYFKKVLADNNFQSNSHHPFVKGIIRRMHEARALRLSDRMILYVSNRNVVKFCMFLSKFIRRIENPALLLNDINRLEKKIIFGRC